MKHKITTILAAVLVLLFLVSCGSEPVPMPEDFEFTLNWGVYGISTYDSNTGDLRKTDDATNPADYITTLKLTEEEYEQVWDILSALDLDKFPDAPNLYDPGNGESEPSETIRLYVTYGDYEKMIFADNISLTHDADNRMGQQFLDACDAIVGMITSSEEWASLPEYEFLYD